jgi:hypothetical protein
MPKIMPKIPQTVVHVHIHEKAKEKKRRQKRRKVSRGGNLRTITRNLPEMSSFPQRRMMPQQQLVVLPEGDKALGVVGLQPALTLQKELIRQQIKEYEAEVRGQSTTPRENLVYQEPFEKVILETPSKNRKQRAFPLNELKNIKISTVLQTRKDEAIDYYNIETEGLSKNQINKKIRELHAEDSSGMFFS